MFYLFFQLRRQESKYLTSIYQAFIEVSYVSLRLDFSDFLPALPSSCSLLLNPRKLFLLLCVGFTNHLPALSSCFSLLLTLNHHQSFISFYVNMSDFPFFPSSSATIFLWPPILITKPRIQIHLLSKAKTTEYS